MGARWAAAGRWPGLGGPQRRFDVRSWNGMGRNEKGGSRPLRGEDATPYTVVFYTSTDWL